MIAFLIDMLIKFIGDIREAFKPDDWEVISHHSCQWTIQEKGKSDYTEHALYTVKYSRSRNIVEIEVGGYKPKQHQALQEIVINTKQYIEENYPPITKIIIK